MKALIIDDDPTYSRLLDRYLSGYFTCVAASNGQAGLDEFRKALDEGEPFDLVCLDVMMPGKDGQQTAREIRMIERERGVPGFSEAKVLMVTAIGDAKSVSRAFFQGGATGYLTKPLDKAVLMNELRELRLIPHAASEAVPDDRSLGTPDGAE